MQKRVSIALRHGAPISETTQSQPKDYHRDQQVAFLHEHRADHPADITVSLLKPVKEVPEIKALNAPVFYGHLVKVPIAVGIGP